MLFNSIDFAVFLPIVFLLYWFVTYRNLKIQNILIVAASYLFYGWWDWRFLSLILFSTALDYSIALKLHNEGNNAKRKLLLWISILVNFGFLGFFKYYNFFLENFVSAFSFFGNSINADRLNIILPVGISFYTFQTLSYTIDVYRKKLEPTNDFIAFAAFVSFFPQLVAGPIERATNLLPQFYKKRNFDYSQAADGMRQIMWGLFKKVVIADNCAIYANSIFENSANLNGSTLLIGALFFTFQIYGDFSGYSDIAIGTARLFGFNLMQNFAFPYFSRDIAEFWRRWHISLSTWFRDYVYIPLGGSKTNKWKIVRNTFIIFVVSGFWHGAEWTYVFWGFLNAVYFLPMLLLKRNRKNIEVASKGKILPTISDSVKIFLTFLITVFAWIFFRAENMSHAFEYISGIFNSDFFSVPTLKQPEYAIRTGSFILVLLITEWFGRERLYALADLDQRWNIALRYVFYYLVCVFVLYFALGSQKVDFIYFQF